MSFEHPIYFPYTYVEPERIERLHRLAGNFSIFRVFEDHEDNMSVYELLRPSSQKSSETARRFLEWAKGMESLDLRALTAFFNYAFPRDDPDSIISHVMEYGKNTDNTLGSVSDLLIKHEITLYLLQLSDSQEYEIASAFKRIADAHKGILDESDRENTEMESGVFSGIDTGFRLKNMNSRLKSWLAVFCCLSGFRRIIFTDEKEAFFELFEYFSEMDSDEFFIYLAEKKASESLSDLSEMLSGASTLTGDRKFSSVPGTLFSGSLREGDCLFFVPGVNRIKKAVIDICGSEKNAVDEFAVCLLG